MDGGRRGGRTRRKERRKKEERREGRSVQIEAHNSDFFFFLFESRYNIRIRELNYTTKYLPSLHPSPKLIIRPREIQPVATRVPWVVKSHGWSKIPAKA